MEFMDKGSLDGIYKKIGAIDIEVVSKVALAVLEGLTYLYDVHRIIHRGELNHATVLVFFVEVDVRARYQAIEYLVQLSRSHQDMRLRCVR
jgi:mitogen-activated protein kinase kinase